MTICLYFILYGEIPQGSFSLLFFISPLNLFYGRLTTEIYANIPLIRNYSNSSTATTTTSNQPLIEPVYIGYTYSRNPNKTYICPHINDVLCFLFLQYFHGIQSNSIQSQSTSLLFTHFYFYLHLRYEILLINKTWFLRYLTI